MNCYKCGCTLNEKNFCTRCGADVGTYKKIVYTSNVLYNDGLEKAKVRDLSGAITSLQQCLKCNNNHIEARNLLGLIYFEMGESVEALNQWVISKNFRTKKNLADDYIDMIQNNPNRLDNIGQTIRKYNQALNYCKQDSLDLALIQLKKVLSLNPKYLKARQLLALLYMQSENWEKAKRELNKCKTIDINNTITLRYLAEVERMLKPDDVNAQKDKKKDKEQSTVDSVIYQSGNETIIQPGGKEKRIAAGNHYGSIINILLGIALGALVVWFLVVPAKEKSARAELDQQLKTISEQKDKLNTDYTDLQQQVSALMEDKESLSNQLESLGGEEGIKSDYDRLLECINMYLSDPTQISVIADSMAQIDTEYLGSGASDAYIGAYNNLKKLIGSDAAEVYYQEGSSAYNDGYYEEAITALAKAVAFQPEHADALFLLGNSYRMMNNIEMATETYAKVIEQFPNTEVANRAQDYIDEFSLTN